MSEPMLMIHNPHSAVRGIPPTVSIKAADLYIGYFANLRGER